MKVYRLTADIDRKYAQIHSQMEQEPKEGITVMWDDWLVKGNIIPDFIFSVYSISKTKIIEDLQNRFNGLEKIKLLWEKNPKEEVAKNIHRLKWLPKEKVDLSAMITTAQIPFLSQSTVVYSMDSGGKKYIDKGIEFAFCTGRAFAEMDHILESIPFIRYAITANGAYCFDTFTKEEIYKTLMYKKDIKKNEKI